MGTEIERKFLLGSAPGWVAAGDGVAIDQGYLATDGETEVRLRRSGNELTLTAKTGSGVERVESEIELTPDQFDELWPLTDGARLSKRRHTRGENGLQLEVDVYGHPLEGLMVLEVEFDSRHLAEQFDPPGWADRELTGDRRYANRSLALHGLPADR